MKIISAIWNDGGVEYIVRKSTWLLVLYVIKVILLLLILFFLSYLSLKLKDYISNPDAIYIVYMIWVWIWLLGLYIWLKSILSFIIFFYSLEIINETKIYKLNIGIFHVDNISVINISNIQESKSVCEWFLRILFWISDIHIIEQRDIEKVIHFVDNGKQIIDIISNFKDRLVKWKISIIDWNKKED